MTALALLRMFGALAVILALLVGALWVVRRYDIRFPGALGGAAGRPRRLEVVERLSIDPKRSLLLVRRDGNELLVLMTPEGNLLLNSQPDTLASAALTPVEPATPVLFDAERDIGLPGPEGVPKWGGSSTVYLRNMARFQRLTSRRLAQHG